MCINVCIIKIHVPPAHEVKNQRVIATQWASNVGTTLKYS